MQYVFVNIAVKMYFCMEQKSLFSCLLNDQFNKKFGGKKLWTL